MFVKRPQPGRCIFAVDRSLVLPGASVAVPLADAGDRTRHWIEAGTTHDLDRAARPGISGDPNLTHLGLVSGAAGSAGEDEQIVIVTGAFGERSGTL